MEYNFKEICSGPEAQDLLVQGINIVSEVVASTMGYRGRTVLIESDGGLPSPTKDGYDTLKSIYLENPIMNLANLALREASEKTAREAGDATTATIVLAQAFIKNSIEALQKGKMPNEIKKAIDESAKKIIAFLEEKSMPITDQLIYDIAHTSSNGDKELTDLISEAFIKAGENGSVAHFRSNTDNTFLEFIDGNLLEAGYADERFINVYSDRTVLFDENPLVVISEITFKSVNQILPFLDFASTNNRQILIVSEFEFQVQDAILANKLNGRLKVCIVKPPHFGQKRKDVLADLALLCNTNCITTLSGENFQGRFAEFLGSAAKVIVGQTDTILNISENTSLDSISSKIEELKENITKTTNTHEIKYLRERIAKLTGKVSIIKVGALVEAELTEKIARVDDAVCAVRSAKEEGVIAGGGSLLNFASEELNLDPISSEAIKAPFRRILLNADISPAIVNCVYPRGYDVRLYKEVDLIESGIVDSAKAIRNALINAISVNNMVIMTNNIVTNKRFKNE
jgi:chaperonin GroEL